MKYLKVIALILVVGLVVACAPKLPQKDVDAANATFTEAQTAKADVYAPTEFQTAQDAKTALDTELAAQEVKTSGKSYKQTATLVKTLQDAAKKAKDAAAANLEAAKAEVATLLTDSQTLVAAVKADAAAASANAKKAAKAKISVKAVNDQVAGFDQAVTEAQAANDSQDYVTAKTKLIAVKDQAVQLQTTLETAGFKAQ
ncbi:MAG: hypothetical protein NT061_00310 [Spirochaetes bacterium]|nr:hypothetical protein [Spirochaetota bacterium]